MKVRSRHLNVILFADTQRAQAEGLCRISAALNGSAAVHPLLTRVGSALPGHSRSRERWDVAGAVRRARNHLTQGIACHAEPPPHTTPLLRQMWPLVVCRAACARAGACCALTNGGGPPGGPHPRSDPHDRCHMRRSGAHVTLHAARGHDAAVLSPSSPILPAFWSRALLTPLKRDFAGNILFFQGDLHLFPRYRAEKWMLSYAEFERQAVAFAAACAEASQASARYGTHGVRERSGCVTARCLSAL